jgi:PadR family transcriptional regulator AphA
MKFAKSSSRYAILGLLSLKSMSGYDIRQLAQKSIGHFWSESYGQIYPTLRQLVKEGLATGRTERNKGKPDRNVYSITANGLGELRSWLKLPVARENPRSELLLKLFFSGRVPLPESIQHVNRYRVEHQQLLEIYDQAEKQLKKQYSGNPDLSFWLITISFGRHRSQAYVNWCDQTLKILGKNGRGPREKTRS